MVELIGNLFGLIVAAFRLCRLEEVRALIVPEVQFEAEAAGDLYEMRLRLPAPRLERKSLRLHKLVLRPFDHLFVGFHRVCVQRVQKSV